MRSSQSHQRASNFVLERLKSQAALKYVWIDTRSQHAPYFNNQHLNKTDRSAIEPRRRTGNHCRGATWRRCTIPIDPEMPSRPLAPRLGGLAQPRRSAPRPPGPLCRTNPATDRTFGWRECIVKKLAGSIHQMTYLPADQQVYERKFSTLKSAASGLARAITTRSG
jgi:hypothetical protein